VIIVPAGHPVVRRVPITTPAFDAPRVLGVLKGNGWMARDLDAPLDEDFLLTPGAGDWASALVWIDASGSPRRHADPFDRYPVDRVWWTHSGGRRAGP
jgi:hypothetical protein